MRFTNPGFLFALFAISVPIIIHLFSFRKFKRVYFSNVRFLKEIKEEEKSYSKLRDLLILLCRILAIAALVFAFSQPYIPSENKIANAGQASVSVFLDNSFSMEATGSRGHLFKEAVEKAKEIVNAYNPSDKFQLITADFEGKHKRYMSREEFLQQLNEVKISPNTRSLAEIVSRNKENTGISEGSNRHFYIVSDFQKNMIEQKIDPDTSISYYLVPLSTQPVANLYIDSCWFDSPARLRDKPESLRIRIKNEGNRSIENVPVKLFINGSAKGLASFSVGPNAYTDTSVSFTSLPGEINNCRLEISDHPVTYDDKLYFSFSISKKINILVISQDAPSIAVNNLFESDPLFSVTNVNEKSIDYSSFTQYDLIILNDLDNLTSGLSQELRKFYQNGGTVSLFPGMKADINEYNNFLSSINADNILSSDTAKIKVDKLDLNHFIFKNVFQTIPKNMDLPVSTFRYKLRLNSRSKSLTLASYSRNEPFISFSQSENGKLYLFATPLSNDAGNFTRHALFVPIMYNIALYSEPMKPLYYKTTSKSPIEISQHKTGENVYKVSALTEKFEAIPEVRSSNTGSFLYTHDQIKKDGNYILTLGQDTLRGLSFNYDRRESVMQFAGIIDVQTAFGNKQVQVIENNPKGIKKILSELNEGKKLWRLFLILALLFLGAEILIIRLMKN